MEIEINKVKILIKENILTGLIGNINIINDFNSNITFIDNYPVISSNHDLENLTLWQELFNLDENIFNKSNDKLSLGEKKVLQLFDGFAQNKNIIILKEPFYGLDYFYQRKVINALHILKIKYNKTIIIYSRDVNIIYEICDEVIVLESNKVILSGKTIEVFTDDKYIYQLPDIVKFTNLVRKKKPNFHYLRDIRDLIKDVYKNV